MRFWDVGIVTNLLAIFALLAVVGATVRIVPRLRRLAVPPAIVAGLVGLALGRSGIDVLPTRTGDLELIVYHTFAVVFIAVGLQAPAAGSSERTGAARSLAVAIPTMGAAQAMLGFALVAMWWAMSGDELHPGLAWMITLGFQQGPGQALAFGGAWEAQGMTDGAQIGLVFAAFGFLHCGLLGVPLVAYARRRGLVDATPTLDAAPDTTPLPRARRTTEVEPLSTQVLLIAVVYVAVFGVLWAITAPMPADSPLRATFWGFHFIVGAGLAIALRRGAQRVGRDAMFDDDLLARISVLAVEISTAAAIAAVELDVLTTWLVPVLVFTTLAGGLTLLGSVWLARRVFPDAPFAHTLVLFGMSTGTISTGLALLRMIDPELRGPVARNVVVAATASVPLGVPLFLGVIPFSVAMWSTGFGAAIGWPMLALLLYLAVLVIAWRRLTPARWARPWWRVWPPRP